MAGTQLIKYPITINDIISNYCTAERVETLMLLGVSRADGGGRGRRGVGDGRESRSNSNSTGNNRPRPGQRASERAV